MISFPIMGMAMKQGSTKDLRKYYKQLSPRCQTLKFSVNFLVMKAMDKRGAYVGKGNVNTKS